MCTLFTDFYFIFKERKKWDTRKNNCFVFRRKHENKERTRNWKKRKIKNNVYTFYWLLFVEWVIVLFFICSFELLLLLFYWSS